MPALTGQEVIAIIPTAEGIVTTVVTDVLAFKRWLSQNTDAADTTQLQANDAEFATMIAEESAKAGGTGVS